MSEVRCFGVTKAYTPEVKVLDGINLHVAQGEMFFLLGSSGCGKSTLLRIIAGLISLDSGKIEFDNVDISSKAPEERGAAMVFQNYALWPHMNVFDNVAFGLKMKHLSKKEIAKQVSHALSQVHLEDFASRGVPNLSGGQQQRVALARALAVNPNVLLLDEPLSNLDANLRDVMRKEIKKICFERGVTAIYVTHDRREALSLADKVGVMHQGKLMQIGTPEEIYFHPNCGFVASFLGDVNTLPSGGGIRPEHLHVHSENRDGRIPAKLLEYSFFGESSEVRFQAEFGELVVKELGAPKRVLGETYFLSYDEEFIVPVGK